jgi:hypothetical protein
MFVLEHQPLFCQAYPASGECTFTDIYLEVEGKEVKNPAWESHQEKPKCDSKATVVNSTAISFTWQAKSLSSVEKPESAKTGFSPAKWGYGK